MIPEEKVWVSVMCTTCGNDQAERVDRDGSSLGPAKQRYRMTRAAALRHAEDLKEAVCIICSSRTIRALIEPEME